MKIETYKNYDKYFIQELEDTSLAVVFSHEDKLTNELIKATNTIIGDAIIEDFDIIESGIKVGIKENSIIKGTALANRTGTIEGNISTEEIGGLVLTKQPDFKTNYSIKEETITIEEIGNIASSNDFKTDVYYTKKKKGNGYLFRLVMSPKDNTYFKKIDQNMVFLNR